MKIIIDYDSFEFMKKLAVGLKKKKNKQENRLQKYMFTITTVPFIRICAMHAPPPPPPQGLCVYICVCLCACAFVQTDNSTDELRFNLHEKLMDTKLQRQKKRQTKA